MAIELLLKEKTLLRKPWIIFLIAIIFSSIGIVFATALYRKEASLVMVFFTIVPLVPIFVRLIEHQEEALMHLKKLKIRKLILMHFTWLFLGLVVSFSLWYYLVPEPHDTNLFSKQIESIYDLEGPFAFAVAKNSLYQDQVICDGEMITLQHSIAIDFDQCFSSDYNKNGVREYVFTTNGEPEYVLDENGKLKSFKIFLVQHIFKNNFWILIFVYITSFTFGAGSLFMLVWNASIVGVFVGDAIKKAANAILGVPFFGFLLDFPKVLFPLLIHGIFEFGGFFGGAIAGGILSVAVMRHPLRSHEFAVIFRDSIQILFLSVLMIFVGAVLEIYI